MARCELCFVGSVPMADAREVFSTLGSRFGQHARRLPDGETNERLQWVAWQERVFVDHPDMEVAPPEADWRMAGGNVSPIAAPGSKTRSQYRLRPGADVSKLTFKNLAYLDVALESYAEFAKLKHDGVIPAACRFVVAIPSTYNVMSWGIAPEARVAIEPIYERALLAEVAAMTERISPHELAIQWDCAHDMQAFEGARTPWFTPPREGIIERLARLGNAVHPAVELGYHFCYGTYGGRHFVEPKDAQAMVDLANAVSSQVRRTIEWIHMPVPIERNDDAYFAPLKGLRKKPETVIHLGLIHDQDGLAGTQSRIKTAERYLGDFGVATECGFGRRDPASLAKLLDVHRDVLQAVCAKN